MSWETLNLNDVVQAAKPRAIPEGIYTLRLLSVKNSPFVTGRLDFDMVIDDGEYKSRRVFPTLPEPDSKDHWAAQAAAKFLKVLGVEQTDGETILETYNRAATNGAARFTGNVTVRSFTDRNGTTQEKNDLAWFSVAPSA